VNPKLYIPSEKVNILKEYGFQKFDLNTVQIYESYLKKMNGPTGSYMRVANIICWGFYSVPYYTILDDFFIIINDDCYYRCFSVYAPVGDYENTKGLKRVLDFLGPVLNRLDQNLKLYMIKEWMQLYFDQLTDYDVDYSYDPAESDYLYDLNQLADSINRRSLHYEHKISSFEHEYKPEITQYASSDYNSCMRIIEEMCCDTEGCEACIFGCFKEFYKIVFSCINEINGKIVMFKSSGKIIAFVVFVEGEDILYFDRKAKHNLFGFSEYLNQYIVQTYGNRFHIMNFEEDMGKEGLRRHKRALGPYMLSHNYCMKVKKRNGKE